ncbi:hypothetical protein BaRGS_00018520 [Batillaria attramentaria]|uniref:Globin n=1 Tax=Batillaria attramentaria TaxID=370345 RepID=A0ABD0KSN6_9CAEN
MGCGFSKSRKLSTKLGFRTEERQLVGLTRKDIQLMRSTWAAFKEGDYQRDGTYIFLILFTDKPETMAKFHFIAGSTEKELMDNVLLQSHVGKLVERITVFVDTLDNLPAHTNDWQELGRRHVGYGVKLEYLKDVVYGIVYAMKRKLKARYSQEAKTAWLKALQFVHANMWDGMVAGGAVDKKPSSLTIGKKQLSFRGEPVAADKSLQKQGV